MNKLSGDFTQQPNDDNDDVVVTCVQLLGITGREGRALQYIAVIANRPVAFHCQSPKGGLQPLQELAGGRKRLSQLSQAIAPVLHMSVCLARSDLPQMSTPQHVQLIFPSSQPVTHQATTTDPWKTAVPHLWSGSD